MHLQLAALIAVASRVLVTVDRRAAQIRWLARALRRADIGVLRVGPGAIPAPRSLRPGRLRLGTFSTLGRDKRFDVLLDCFARVHARRPEAELVVLGDLADAGDPRLRAFHDAVAGHPASAAIRIPGKLALDDVAREIAELDVYLFPMLTGANTRSSTLPVALGTGLPVVAIRGVETDGLFVDGENVTFADSLSGEAFAAAVLAIAERAELGATLSAGASALFEHELSWPRIGDQFLAQI